MCQKTLLFQGRKVLLTQWELGSRKAFSFSGNTLFLCPFFPTLVCAEITVCLFALSVFKASSSLVYGASLSWVMSNILKLFYIHFLVTFKSGWILTQWHSSGHRGSSFLPVCCFLYGLPSVMMEFECLAYGD